MDDFIEAVELLLKFIEENDIQDEMADDGDGHIDTWRSPQFDQLLTHTQEKLGEVRGVKS
ncbi:hypothetical protein LCGC14_1223820 [marine sediment metagenome]|uniref:Uncharacterized protein n=1 Tax=marine sediment metagenome TaxID=412755 RepID=A0A0F9LXQ4_9ZZZZ